MAGKSTLRELIELEELKAYQELKEATKKKDEKKPVKWWWINPLKLYLILVLLYPIIGPAYKNLVLALWR